MDRTDSWSSTLSRKETIFSKTLAFSSSSSTSHLKSFRSILNTTWTAWVLWLICRRTQRSLSLSTRWTWSEKTCVTRCSMKRWCALWRRHLTILRTRRSVSELQSGTRLSTRPGLTSWAFFYQTSTSSNSASIGSVRLSEQMRLYCSRRARSWWSHISTTPTTRTTIDSKRSQTLSSSSNCLASRQTTSSSQWSLGTRNSSASSMSSPRQLTSWWFAQTQISSKKPSPWTLRRLRTTSSRSCRV